MKGTVRKSQLSIENLAQDVHSKDEWEDPFKKEKKKKTPPKIGMSEESAFNALSNIREGTVVDKGIAAALDKLTDLHPIEKMEFLPIVDITFGQTLTAEKAELINRWLSSIGFNKQERDMGLNPSVHEMANEAYDDSNQFEDVRMHMGQITASDQFSLNELPRQVKTRFTEPVREPNNTKEYGMGSGPDSEAFEDKTMVSFASMEGFEKEEGAGQIDVTFNEDEVTTIPRNPPDMSIPRR